MPSDFDYGCSLSIMKGVGPKILDKLAHCGLHNFRDALFYFPIRYEDKTKITSIAQCIHGETVVVQGVIKKVWLVKTNLFVELQEQALVTSPILRLVFFHLNAAQRKTFKINALLRCHGVAQCRDQLTMMHPDFKMIADYSEPLESTLTPIYSTTEGLHQSSLRKIIAQVLRLFGAQWGNTTTGAAILCMHQPPANTDSHSILTRQHPICQHLITKELSHQLYNLKKIKLQNQADYGGQIKINQTIQNNLSVFFKNLTFELTKAQQRVIQQITDDLSSTQLMMRLVQGDVGSGKTIVAGAAALIALSDGKQVALMAPTELLAFQLFQNFQKWFLPFGFECIWLSGNMSEKDKAHNVGLLLKNKPLIAIGTHALFQDTVKFHNLALIIIDEQHRFGVHQRLAFIEKGLANKQAHQLVMTATPIPRTLAMTQYANLDISIIDELPLGRKPIKTLAMSQPRRAEIIEKITALCQSGQQVYWLCTVIEASQDYQTAENSFKLLQAQCTQCQVGLIHGRLSAQEKESVMASFKAGTIQILVATTVIEVGVDVPNATLMVIENPERLGLAQLHQLRGRVGRGALQSFCILLYKLPLSDNAKARLDILRVSQDGFVIAEKDLELRGSGDILGVNQSGGANFKILDLNRDKDIIIKLSESFSHSVYLDDADTNKDYYLNHADLFEYCLGKGNECQLV